MQDLFRFKHRKGKIKVMDKNIYIVKVANELFVFDSKGEPIDGSIADIKIESPPGDVYTATIVFVHPYIAGSKEEMFKQIEELKKIK